MNISYLSNSSLSMSMNSMSFNSLHRIMNYIHFYLMFTSLMQTLRNDFLQRSSSWFLLPFKSSNCMIILKHIFWWILHHQDKYRHDLSQLVLSFLAHSISNASYITYKIYLYFDSIFACCFHVCVAWFISIPFLF